MSEPTTKRSGGGFRAAFRHRDFAIYAFASFISNVGMWVMRIGIGWYTWDLTHSGAWLGAVALGQALPSVVLTPFAGALADRMDPVRLMRVTQAASFWFAAAIAGVTFMGWATPFLLVAWSFCHGIAFALGLPARTVVGPNLVPREDISAAISVGSVIFGSSMFIGPAISGLLIEHFGPAWTFTVNAIAYGTMYFCLLNLKLLRAERHKSGGSLIADTVEGVKFVMGHEGIRAVMLLAFIISLCIRPMIDLMPGFADAVYHRPTEGLATLMSAFGIGAMIGSVWLANRNRLSGTVTIAMLGNAASAIFMIVFAGFGIYPLAIAAMFGFGISAALGFNGAQILVQNAAAGPMRSRVMGLYAYNFQGVPAAGAMLMGFASGFLGLQIPAVAAGTASLLATLWVMRSRKRIVALMEHAGEALPGKKI
ncbi:MAG: transporter [Rhodospirillales bacterium]|jgi:predicted MFS family arabinose efflux permease|nr:transporter [Rhodospirillales bacterium]